MQWRFLGLSAASARTNLEIYLRNVGNEIVPKLLTAKDFIA
jgi:hypothetical protein